MTESAPACPLCLLTLESDPGLARLAAGSYQRCPGCGWLRRLHRPESERLLYRQGYHTRPGVKRAANRRSRLHAHLLSRLGPARGRLLDVGCADGRLLARASRLGWDCEGLEPDPAVAGLARGRSQARIHATTIEQAELSPGAYAAILLVNVLDQLSDPAAALERCRRWLRSDGTLVLRLPNGDLHKRLMRIADRSGPDGVLARLTPLHLHVIPSAALRGLLERSGFTHSRLRPSPLLLGRVLLPLPAALRPLASSLEAWAR